jgi:hypothetical protein
MKALTIGGVVCLLLCAGGTRVEAQGVVSSFDQLGVLVKPGDKITVVDVTGREVEGRIGKLSRETLTLITGAGRGNSATLRSRGSGSAGATR